MFLWCNFFLCVGVISDLFFEYDQNFNERLKSMLEFNGRIFHHMTPFFAWSIGYWGLKSYFEMVNEKTHSANLLLYAKNAQLQMLRYQINPHFLFNSLNSIKALTYENPGKADFMITELSEFLRATLNYNDRVYIPITEEIEIIEKYLSIEKIRFEERLKYKITFEKSILNKDILCFITQPLIENAIKHGLTNNPVGINLSINFTKIEDYLVIEILNNGVLKNTDNPNGTGLKNVTERLDNAYPDQYLFCVNQENDLVRARLLIPDK